MGMRGVEKEGRHEQMDTEEEVNSTGREVQRMQALLRAGYIKPYVFL